VKRLFLSFTAISLYCLLASGIQAQVTHAQPQTASSTVADDPSQQKTKVYIIRVIDNGSKTPVAKAKISVELENDAKTKWTGTTDENGVFQFRWDAITPRIKSHTSVEAHGYTSIDDFEPLIEDRIIGLTRLSNAPAGKGETR
jgi:predicted carbohydrate-binding protein with CBM5 and CBM33 domain